VDVNVNSTPPKVIGREACLRDKCPFGLSKNHGPKRHPNTCRKEKSKETRDFVKVEIGDVHRKKYNERCM